MAVDRDEFGRQLRVLTENFAEACSVEVAESLLKDSIWGTKAIADFLGTTPGKVSYLIRQGQLPVMKASGRLFASRRLLERYMDGELD